MSPSCIACDMLSAMLSNLLWASSLITSCFSCFLVNILKDLRVVDVWTEKIRLVPLNAIPTDWPTSLANPAMETPSVILLMLLDLYLQCLWFYSIVPSFLANFCEVEFNQATLPQFHSIFSSIILVALVELYGLGQDTFYLFHYHRYSKPLFNNWRWNLLGIINLLYSSSCLKPKWPWCFFV